MPPLYRAPRGTRDLLPDDRPYWDRVENAARCISTRYGFQKIDTPTFENTGLFIRGVGEGTDIVEKEMYTFQDKGDNSITLRSEGTAPVMRAYLQNGMQGLPQPVKLFYLASIFRYDRPQAGRYREHKQFGVEAIGETDPLLDAEIITLASDFYKTLGLSRIYLQLNNIGCPKCRPIFLKKLIEYYQNHKDELCGDCKRRLVTNPLRLFDCKVESCQELIAQAPKITDSLCEECRTHFDTLQSALQAYKVPFTLNPTLVRGLDYYTKTVFEFWTEGIGAQNALGGGGRYDGLAESLGGRNAPGIGFGLGLDRVILTMQEQEIEVDQPPPPGAFLITLGDAAREYRPLLLRSLRDAGIRVANIYGKRSMKAQMRQANTSGTPFTLILGDRELEKGQIACRNMETGEQTEIRLDQVIPYLKPNT
ncbi:MAG: histidine--tRNA ligase [bacterium]|nr:histidine--tRNA ligase [bacterium]